MNGSVVPAKLNAPPLSSRTRLRAWALRSLAFGLCLATALTPVAAHAQEMKGVIRDAEVENLRPWWIRLHRLVGVPFRTCRRALLTALGIRSRSGRSSSEVFPELAHRRLPAAGG